MTHDQQAKLSRFLVACGIESTRRFDALFPERRRIIFVSSSNQTLSLFKHLTSLTLFQVS